MASPPLLGPIALCTLVAADGAGLVAAYTGWLHQQVAASGALDGATASAIGQPQLAGNPSWLLQNAAGRTWLQVIECPLAPPRDHLATYGWLAMEVLVGDVDQLAASLADSPFELLRPAADLDLSDQIRACQARGPAGEILYLTQVKAPVPPFELPRCEAPVDHLFIPVLSTPSRELSLAQYAQLADRDGLCFDTRITVVNQARGFDLQRRHPVATLQLAGDSLLELDQIGGTVGTPQGICQGIACVAFACQRAAAGNSLTLQTGPFSGSAVSAHTGFAGEHYVLVHPQP